jgi:hypothetical protein
MKKHMVLAMLGVAIALAVAAPSKANAQVVIGVRIGAPVVARPVYVVTRPRPYSYAYYPRPYAVAPVVAPVFAPVYVRPAGYYYRGRWCPRPVYRGYVNPRYFRR